MTHIYQHASHPWRRAWQRIANEARDRGLIHGMRAAAILGGSPADAAMLLTAMVEAGTLLPIAKDLAGAGHSARAFRGLQRLRESKPTPQPDPTQWLNSFPSEAADAHLWTFEARTPKGHRSNENENERTNVGGGLIFPLTIQPDLATVRPWTRRTTTPPTPPTP